MKYTKEQRFQIGKEIYTRQLTKYEAALKYDIDVNTARTYMRLYRDANSLPHMNAEESVPMKIVKPKPKIDYSNLETLTKEQLIDEVIKAKVECERAKKGYTVKGGGQEKEFINLSNQNSK